MKFTLDLKTKTIQIHGKFTKEDLTEIFNVLKIDNIETYTIETIKNETETYWSQDTTHTGDLEFYQNNTGGENLSLVYKNILHTL